MGNLRFISVGLAVTVVASLWFAGGCSTTSGLSGRGTGGVSSDLFAPLPVPPDFDPKRARLSLSEIPDDPPAPAKTDVLEPVELPETARRRIDEAKRLFAEQRYTETISELEQVLRYNANNHQAHKIMAIACLLSGSEGRARNFADRALAINANDLVCHYILGRLAEQADKKDEALREYRVALKCASNHADTGYRALTNYYLGLLLYEAGYYAAAIEQLGAFELEIRSLGEQLDENPELATIVRIHRGSTAIRLARAHEWLGQYASASDALKIAVAKSPTDRILRTEFVRMLVRAGRINEAAQEASRFVADSNGEREAVKLLLAVHQFTGRPEVGVQAIRNIITRQPDNIDLWLIYVDALLAANRHAEAIQALTELIAANPQATDARWKLIELHRSRKDWRSWLVVLAEELSAHPAEYIRATQELHRVPTQTAGKIVDEGLGEPANRGRLVPSIPSNDRLNSALDFLIGRLCDRLDRVEDAGIAFERSAGYWEEFLPATIGAAETYVSRCRWHDALKVIEAADKAQEKSGHQIERLLGQCHDGLDEVDQAIQHYEKAIELNSADVISMKLLGELYDRANQPGQAQKQYQAIIAIDPNNMPAREALIRNLLARNQNFMNQKLILARILSELTEMQRLAGQDPATIRCTALIKSQSGQDLSRQAYFEVLKKLIQVYPDDLRSREDLAATLLFVVRDYESARIELAEILTRDPFLPEAHEMMSLALMKLLAFDQATDQFARMLELYPNRQQWIYNFAELCLIKHQYDAAIALWTRLMSLQSVQNNTRLLMTYRVRLMQIYQLAKRFEDARHVAEGWLAETKPDDPHFNLCRSLVLDVDAGAKDYDRYLARCRKWFEADPTEPNIRHWLLTGLIAAKRFDEALLLTLDWLAEAPEKSHITGWVIHVLQSAKRYDQAIEVARSHLSAADKADERLVRLQMLYGVYLLARRYDEAVGTARELIAQGQKSYAESLGTLLSEAERFDEAIEYFNKLIGEASSDSEKAQLLRMLSATYQRQERMDLAEERMREAYRLAPLDAGINNDLGYTLADAGKDLDEAERMIRFAVSEVLRGAYGEDARQPAYMDSLGWVLYKKGKLNEARTWLMRSASLETGQDAVIFDHLGDVQWRLEDKDQAIKSWNQAIEIHKQRAADGEQGFSDEKLLSSIMSKLEQASKDLAPAVAPIADKGG